MNSYAANGNHDVLSKEDLTSNDWGPNVGELGLFFKFALDGSFKTEANFEGDGYYSGTYEINGNRLVLKIIKADTNRGLIGKNLAYQLVQDKKAIYFFKYLALETSEKHWDGDIKKLWNQSNIVKNGEHRIYQDINVETLNNIAVIKEKTNYYQFPSTGSKRFMFSAHDDGTDKNSELSHTIPLNILQSKKMQVQLILKTIKQDSDGHYWYCIYLPVGTGGYDSVILEGSTTPWSGSNFGWIKEIDLIEIKKK
jgi:hypothetical protein